MKTNIIFLAMHLALFCNKTTAQGVSFDWAKSIGGSAFDNGYAIAVDATGNVYTTGSFFGTADFDPGAGVYTLTSSGDYEIFVSKVDALGAFVWAVKMGGPNADDGRSIAVDAAGNVYTTGSFQGTADFDPGPAVYDLTVSGSPDIFISKLNSSGGFVWAKQLGGTNGDNGQAIAVDGTGNVYTTGQFSGTGDFDPGAGVFNLSAAGIFVSKLNNQGVFVWAKGIGGTTGLDNGTSIAVDVNGFVYTAGKFLGPCDFDPGAGVFNLTSGEMFVSKLDGSGTFVWAKSLGGLGYYFCLSLDAGGSVYTTGQFAGTADFDPGPSTFNLTSSGSNDVFISKLNAAGDFVWAKNIGGSGGDMGYGIVVDAFANTYISGSFQGIADLDPGPGVSNFTSVGGSDAYVCKLDGAGDLLWAKQFGGAGNEYPLDLAVTGAGNIFITGNFDGTSDFDPGTSTYNITSSGATDVFVLKLIDGTTGLPEEKNSSNSISVYPNPGNGLFFVSYQNNVPLEIVIYNMVGSRILNFTMKDNFTSFDISSQPKGMYFMDMNVPGSALRMKIVKE